MAPIAASCLFTMANTSSRFVFMGNNLISFHSLLLSCLVCPHSAKMASHHCPTCCNMQKLSTAITISVLSTRSPVRQNRPFQIFELPLRIPNCINVTIVAYAVPHKFCCETRASRRFSGLHFCFVQHAKNPLPPFFKFIWFPHAVPVIQYVHLRYLVWHLNATPPLSILRGTQHRGPHGCRG